MGQTRGNLGVRVSVDVVGVWYGPGYACGLPWSSTSLGCEAVMGTSHHPPLWSALVCRFPAAPPHRHSMFGNTFHWSTMSEPQDVADLCGAIF